MMKIHKIAAALSFAAAMTVAAPAMADTNRALEAWKAFAAEQKNPNYDKWVSLISDPKAIALAKEWKDLRGYDAYDLIDKANIPAELKPGLVITKDNKANYPWLKEYLPEEIYNHIGSAWGNIAKIKIGNHYIKIGNVEEIDNNFIIKTKLITSYSTARVIIGD